MKIKHRLQNYQISKKAEILILGTFLPETLNDIDFFYGSLKNELWQLLPTVIENKSLSLIGKSKSDKIQFMQKHKIDFFDLINEVKVDNSQQNNRKDSFIDSKVTQWNDIINLLEENKNIHHVFFTRTTVKDIPNIKEKIISIEKYCKLQNISFSKLITPSKAYRGEKLSKWQEAFECITKPRRGTR